MIKRKICLLGDFGVGKTSLIKKYVLNVYSEKYLSTVGVLISKKEVLLASGTEITLVIWDLEGQENFTAYESTYLRGMSGYILVADGTRPETLESVRTIRDSMFNLFPEVPCILLLNKVDLQDQWKLKDNDYVDFTKSGIFTSKTSAKTGAGVEDSFLDIAEQSVKS